MGLSCKGSTVLLQIFHHFKVDALPFSVTFQPKPQLFAYVSGTWKTDSQLYLKKARGTLAKIPHSCG